MEIKGKGKMDLIFRFRRIYSFTTLCKKCLGNPNNNYIMEAHVPKYPIGIGTSFYDGNKISWGISPLKYPKNILIHEMYYFHMIQFTKNRELPKEWELEVFDIFKKMPRIDWRDK